MNNSHYWSRLPGFFSLDLEKRRESLLALPLGIACEDLVDFDLGLSLADADTMSENVIGIFHLPFSIAGNFVVDKQPVLVPMVTEEPSIVAACSKIAKLTAQWGGFTTEIDPPIIKGQIQLYNCPDLDKALAQFAAHKAELMAMARSLCMGMHARGGGVVDMTVRVVPSDKIGPMLIVEPLVNVVDAMGANAINTLLEGLADKIAAICDGTVGIKILSNLCDRRLARARCTLSFADLASDHSRDNGPVIAERLMAAHALAEADIYRACTHNKGILNGIDAVALATGNDFRALEAGAHAYAASQGAYRPLTSLDIDRERQVIHVSLAMPLAVGVVGGVVKMHRGVRFAHRLLGPFAKTSSGLASVMVSAGLSQCVAALLALSQDGIQKGHMKLHKKKLAYLSRETPQQPSQAL